MLMIVGLKHALLDTSRDFCLGRSNENAILSIASVSDTPFSPPPVHTPLFSHNHNPSNLPKNPLPPPPSSLYFMSRKVSTHQSPSCGTAPKRPRD